MTRQKRRDTEPELAVRRAVSSIGFRFRIGNKALPGSPDLSNQRAGWAIFVHGCFWHGHVGCPRATVPKRNKAFWMEKIADNSLRDARKVRALRERGLSVKVVWECETRNPEFLSRKLRRFLVRSR